MHLRSDKIEKEYSDYRNTIPHGCPLCRECETPVKEFRYWILIHNRFPYDKVAKRHDMLVLKSHKSDMDFREYAELLEIKENLQGYHAVIENLPVTMSVPAHLHCHCLEYK